jgi:hypothetical protein
MSNEEELSQEEKASRKILVARGRGSLVTCKRFNSLLAVEPKIRQQEILPRSF